KTIEALVNIYDANINIHNAQGITPLGCLISSNFNLNAAMKLIRLGADPYTIQAKGNSLLDILKKNNENGQFNEAIDEIDQLAIKYFKIFHHKERNDFLNFLILLSCDINNGNSQ